MPAGATEVVVYGGYGFFGRLVVEDILRHTSACVVVAGRRPPHHLPWGNRVAVAVSDLNDFSSVKRILRDARVVVHCAGPFQKLPLNVLRAAIEEGVHYIDLADDREFVRRVDQWDDQAKQAGIAVLCGLSVVPGMTVLLTQAMRSRFDQIHTVRTFVAPGTRGSRGMATFASLLSAVGEPFTLPRDGCEQTVFGWSEPEWVEFPPPIGWRLTYLAIPVADFDLVPRDFGAKSVEFKAGSEFAWLNQFLGFAARWRQRRLVPAFGRWASVLQWLVRGLGWIGTDCGGAMVQVLGTKGEAVVQQQMAVVAKKQGSRIPCLLAGIGVAALLEGKVSVRGIVPLHTWIGFEQLVQELALRGVTVWWKDDDLSDWRRLTPLENASFA